MSQLGFTNLTTSSRPRISRDEMNLAEFPLTILSTRSNAALKTLEFSDSVRGRSGEIIDRKWIITGADKFGLPTASDDEVLLGLLKLTVDDGFKDRKVYFTRYELLRILRWSTEGRSYTRLQRALDRLSGVRIKATNAFYDNESKSHSTRNFGLVDAYEINDGRNITPKPSFFVWSDVLFKSFQVGFIKKLDLDFYLGLESAVSKRLYRYLDKHFWYRSKVEINLFVLAHEKIGVSRNYNFASQLRQQIDPAIEELIEQRFLSRAEYLGKGRDTVLALYAASSIPRSKQLTSSEKEPLKDEDNHYAKIAEALIARGIKEEQGRRLLSEKTAADLKKIEEIIAYFDELRRTGSALISKSPVGFLYRAVQNFATFVLPRQRALITLPKKETPSPKPTVDRLKSQYLIERKRELLRLREGAEPALLSKLTLEVERGLSKVKQHISASRFAETVSHGVEEKLAKLYKVPSFEEWQALNGGRE